MSKADLRIILLLTILACVYMMFDAWNREQKREEALSAAEDIPSKIQAPKIIPRAVKKDQKEVSAEQVVTTKELDETRLITVTTDVYIAKIDKRGGDFVYLELLQYPGDLKNKQKGFVLLDTGEKYYVAQSGMLSEHGPDVPGKNRATFSSAKENYVMVADTLQVDLNYKVADPDVLVTKRLEFARNNYAIKVSYIIANNSNVEYNYNFYQRLRRSEPKDTGGGFFGAMRTYTGAAVHTPEKAYLKLPFADMSKTPYTRNLQNSWAAMVEHYFTGAWIPEPEVEYAYQTEFFKDGTFGLRATGGMQKVAPHTSQTVSSTLYAGPAITDDLKQLAPGLDLTVDYGVLWWLCQPLFWLLKKIHSVVNNWGAAIILITIGIKLAFYHLSASSYRSMGKMRKLQPRIEALKKQFADDRTKFGQAVMELYKREKVNPMGGCLPIVIQIPVFIALYYVLLESVELRQAPFLGWVQDLSAKDPFYVLPVLMGASMFLQQRMNPQPPDPIQAKVFMFMPLLFTVLFLNFPAGLVLYWVVNNVLSIGQQWFITRSMDAERSKV